MTDSTIQRLSSSHLEDMAFIVLSASQNDEGEAYPDLSEDVRTRLRSRLKQMSRFDWPSSMGEDPDLRRGYTLRQCLRLAIALLLLDAHLPAGLAVVIACNNERAFLAGMMTRLAAPRTTPSAPDDLIAVILPAEIRDSLDVAAWTAQQTERVRLVKRKDLASLWSDACAGPGARLAIDMGTAAAALWRWLHDRRLMTDAARLSLLSDIEAFAHHESFERIAHRKLRR